MNVLLDLDGTLTDPAPGFVNCIRYALGELRIECPSDAEVASHIGPPLEETLSKLLGDSQASQIPEAVRLYRKRYATDGLFENAVYGGIFEALERIRNLKATIFLATSKPRVDRVPVRGVARLIA